jgi:hypothetical protein
MAELPDQAWLSTAPMADIVSTAWNMRDQFDLEGIGYGKIHWGNHEDIVNYPYNYYFFLAGMVRLTGARKIVEVGTHQGGSARAMCKGLIEPEGSKLVTFDVTDEGVKSIGDHPILRAYQVDANSEEAYNVCLNEFGTENIDMAYIDTAHDFWPTFLSMQVYGEALDARFIVLDDITLNPEMDRFWALMRKRYGEGNTIDASAEYPDIRGGGDGTRPGFGVIRILPRSGA